MDINKLLESKFMEYAEKMRDFKLQGNQEGYLINASIVGFIVGLYHEIINEGKKRPTQEGE